VLPCSAFLVSHSNVDARNTNAASRLFVASPEKEGLAGNLTTVDQAMTLQQQAQALREEALALQKTLEASKMEKIIKENTKIDQWIEELFVQYQIDENTEMLNDVDQVFERLKDDRYSQEQVNKIFNRICETGPPQSRSNCSPLMSTLVDAVGKLDSVERDDNPNKRWSGRVERVLRKRLFALDWGMDLEDDDDEGNPWRIG
jgi:hypothetical protein